MLKMPRLFAGLEIMIVPPVLLIVSGDLNTKAGFSHPPYNYLVRLSLIRSSSLYTLFRRTAGGINVKSHRVSFTTRSDAVWTHLII